MLSHFRSSPLWLIGLFVIFAEGISAIAAIQLTGWSQRALVVFVIAYASVVTLIFFGFLWKKPENFYSPADYASTTPKEFIDALRGLPRDVKVAVDNLSEDPGSKSKRYRLLSNLLKEEVKQHLILMARSEKDIDISSVNDQGHTHHYRFLLRNGGMSMGLFSPRSFMQSLDGTDTVMLTGDEKRIVLLPEGREFAEWLIKHKLDAESFESQVGSWGEPFDPFEILSKHSGRNPE